MSTQEMRTRIVLRGGTVIDETGTREADVAITANTITQVRPGLAPAEGDEVHEVAGLIVAPGLVDVHTHLREPGREEAETIATGTRAAVAGGYSAVTAMPNTEPTTDSAVNVRALRGIIARDAHCEVFIAASLTRDRQGTELAPFDELYREGVRLFTDDGTCIDDDNVMRRACEYLTMFPGAIAASHCESHALSKWGVMHEGAISAELGVVGQPPLAEELMVAREIAFAEMTGCRVHLMHITTERGLQLYAQAKDRGVPVSAEIAPHHFTLTDAALRGYDPLFRVAPPLRPESDRLACIEALQSGLVEIIATDHAPHIPNLKDLPLEEAPVGMLGLQTALALSLTHLGMEPQSVLAALSWNPARWLGVHSHMGGRQGGPIMEGNPANLVVFDPSAEWVVRREDLLSKAKNSPYLGRTLRGKVRHTIVEGSFAFQEGQVRAC